MAAEFIWFEFINRCHTFRIFSLIVDFYRISNDSINIPASHRSAKSVSISSQKFSITFDQREFTTATPRIRARWKNPGLDRRSLSERWFRTRVIANCTGSWDSRMLSPSGLKLSRRPETATPWEDLNKSGFNGRTLTVFRNTCVTLGPERLRGLSSNASRSGQGESAIKKSHLGHKSPKKSPSSTYFLKRRSRSAFCPFRRRRRQIAATCKMSPRFVAGSRNRRFAVSTINRETLVFLVKLILNSNYSVYGEKSRGVTYDFLARFLRACYLGIMTFIVSSLIFNIHFLCIGGIRLFLGNGEFRRCGITDG